MTPNAQTSVLQPYKFSKNPSGDMHNGVPIFPSLNYFLQDKISNYLALCANPKSAILALPLLRKILANLISL